MADQPKPQEDEDIKKIDAMMSVSETDGTPAVSTSVDPHFEKPKSAPKLPQVYKPQEPVKPPIVIKLAEEKAPEPSASVGPPAAPEPPQPVQPPAEPAPPAPAEESTNLDDKATDEAVDDIAAKDGDMVLAVEDARRAKKGQVVVGGPGFKERMRAFFRNKWTWAIVVLLLVMLLALPMTRYKVLGLFIKKSVGITVVDSKTNTPVSGAQVTLAGATAKTDAEGQAHLKAGLGKRTLTVNKQYYTSLNSSYFVGFKVPAHAADIHLVATGRLVPVTVTNKISGKALSGANLVVKGTTAKTNSKGEASIALPTTATTYTATISLSGYNPATVTIQVTDQAVKANDFSLTPAGHIYFLSNQSGTIDVVKANLDGSGRKTVLAGTGHEDPNTTSLLASRDWHFLVLKSIRSGSQASLNLIDTTTDKVTSFDNSNSDFNLVGWDGHNFIYELTKQDQDVWQPGREQLKSYDADNQQLNQLDQNQAEGSAAGYADQELGSFYIVNGEVVYSTQWNIFNDDATGKNDTIRAIQPNGQNKKDYETVAAASTSFIQAAPYSPQAVYFAVTDNTNKVTYYDFEDQSAKTVALDSGTFSRSYPTFLLSPSGNQTFWTELIDGKNALFVGDDNAGNKKQIPNLSAYTPFGWFSDNYLLAAKNSSELYILPVGGLTAGQQPLKISDYYKPAQSFNGYGGGYGGL